jgi:hypothetical protein
MCLIRKITSYNATILKKSTTIILVTKSKILPNFFEEKTA